MRLLTQEVPESWRLYILGDLHAGASLFHESAFLKAVSAIKKDKHAKVVLMGDLIEAITVDDRRFQYDSTDPTKPTPQMQWEYIIEKLLPIAEKIIVVIDGNHEFALSNFGSVAREVCKGLGIPDKQGSYTCKVNFVCNGKSQFKGFFTHGSRSISTSADDPIRQESNLKLSLKRQLKNKAGDCLVMSMGHAHKLIISPPESVLYLNDDGKEIAQHYTSSEKGGYIHPDHRYYICSGSFLKLYGPDGVSGYAERAGYDPVELGFPKLYIRNNEIVRAEKVII